MSHHELTTKSITEALSFSLYPGATHPLRIITHFGVIQPDFIDSIPHPPTTVDEIDPSEIPTVIHHIPPSIDQSVYTHESDNELQTQLLALRDSVHATYITDVGVALVQNKTTLVSLMHYRQDMFIHPSIAGQAPVKPSPYWRFRTPGKPFRLVRDKHGIQFSTVLSWLHSSPSSLASDSRSAIIGNLNILQPTIAQVDKTMTTLQRANMLNDESIRSVIACSLSVASMPAY